MKEYAGKIGGLFVAGGTFGLGAAAVEHAVGKPHQFVFINNTDTMNDMNDTLNERERMSLLREMWSSLERKKKLYAQLFGEIEEQGSILVIRENAVKAKQRRLNELLDVSSSVTKEYLTI